MSTPLPYFDTMIAAYLLSPGDRRFGLDELSLKYLGEHMRSYTDLVKDEKGKKRLLSEVPFEEVMTYAAHDADVTFRLREVLAERLKKESLWDIFTEIEMPLLPVLERMEAHGVLLDLSFLSELQKKIALSLGALETKIYEEAGEEFNIQSPKQLQVILFEKLGLEPIKKTKTGYSTNTQVLEQLQHVHPLPEMILEYRHLAKLQSTYVEALPQMVNPETGRIHTTFNQTVAATGRLSSVNPNLQNIPIRTDLGKEIRKAFVAPEGWVVMAADYSQIELRLFAHMSNDEALVDAFTSGQDIHSYTASLMFHKDVEEVTRDERRAAKTINFGIIYGMGPFKLAGELGITQKEAKQFIEAYFDTYEGVRHFIDRLLEQAREDLYVSTMFGRKRYLPELQNRNHVLRQAAEREAVNAPLQGSAADLIKKAMILLQQRLDEQNLRTRMVLQVHDELVFEVPEDEIEVAKTLIKTTMEEVATLRVPLIVDVHYGTNWLEAH